MAEEIVDENMTEDTMAEYLETDYKLSEKKETTCFFLTSFLLCCGWFPPGLFRTSNEDAKIPGYIWFFYATFQVIGIGIWIEIVISSIRYCNSRRMIENNLFTLFEHLILCIGVFGYYCVTELYIYKDSLTYFVRFL